MEMVIGGYSNLDGCADYQDMADSGFKTLIGRYEKIRPSLARWCRRSPSRKMAFQRYWEYPAVSLAIGLPPCPGATLLDIGASGSPFPDAMTIFGWYVDAIDLPGSKDLRFGRQEDQKTESLWTAMSDWTVMSDVFNIRWRLGDGTRLTENYPVGSVDAVACLSVLEHMPVEDQEKCWRQFARVLKPGGRLAVTVDCVRDSTVTAINTGCRSHVALYTPDRVREAREILRSEGMNVPIGRDDWRESVPPDRDLWTTRHSHTGKTLKPWRRKWIPYLITGTKK